MGLIVSLVSTSGYWIKRVDTVLVVVLLIKVGGRTQ